MRSMRCGIFPMLGAMTLAFGFFGLLHAQKPVTQVIFQGAKHLSEAELEQITGIRQGIPLNPHANNKACEAIVRKLNAMGHPCASCDLTSGDKSEDSKVIFSITEGPKASIRSISFSGNSWAETGRLASIINSKSMVDILTTAYNAPSVDAGINRLECYYKRFGFRNACVSRELRLTDDGTQYDLIFHVQEGPRTTVPAAPQIINDKSVPTEELEQLRGLKPRAFYSQPIPDADKIKIDDYFGYTGIESVVAPVPVINVDNSGSVKTNSKNAEPPPVRVGQVLIVGKASDKKAGINMGRFGYYPGQILTYPKGPSQQK